jgi:hypothetical protein
MRGPWIVGMGLALLGLLAAVPVPAQEPQRGDLGGQLFREDGQTPIAEATMVVRHTATGAVFQDKTDDRGRFLVHNVPPGDYEVRATVQGILYTYTATVRVIPKALVRLCLAQVPPRQALRLVEVNCETKPLVAWVNYGKCALIRGAATSGGTTKEGAPGSDQEPQRGDVGGQLLREDERTPVANATLVIRHTVKGVVFQDTTNDQGIFLIRDVPIGDYEVRATVQGIPYTYTATVRVIPKALVRICLALVPPYQALRPLEDCKTDFPPFWLRYGRCLIIGGVAVAAATGVVVALPRKEEVTPPRP